MSNPNFIFDGTADNFTTLVLENSGKGPVVVNYWAPWAGPCLKLWPTLESLAREFNGRFLLVNINTEREGKLARGQGVNSLPTLKVYRHGQVVDEVHGAESETSLRALLNRHVARPSDIALAKAVQRFMNGDVDGAFTQLTALAGEDPDNPRVPLTHAKLLFRAARYADTIAVIAAHPALRGNDEASVLLAHAEFMQDAQTADAEALHAAEAAGTLDLDGRYQLAALALQHDDPETALRHLLDILKQDRGFRDGIARRGMTAIFHLLGRDDELSARYRSAMLDILD